MLWLDYMIHSPHNNDSHVIEDKVHHRREDAETHDEVEDLRPAGDDEVDGVDGSVLD